MKTFSDFNISIPTRHTSGQVNTQCPSCSSQRKKKKAPCLSVNIDEGVWLCHHCGWAGSLANGNDSVGSAALHWRKPKYVKPEPLPVTALRPSIIKWFADRGISETTLDETKVNERKVYMPQIESLSMSIAFPYYKNGELINVKYRDAHKNFRLEAGAQRGFYGIDSICGIYTLRSLTFVSSSVVSLIPLSANHLIMDGLSAVTGNGSGLTYLGFLQCRAADPTLSFPLARLPAHPQ